MTSMRIHHKILILNLSLAFIPLFIAGALAYSIGISTLNQLIGQNLRKDAEHVINTIDQELYERMRSQRSWANLRMMQDVRKGDPDGRITSLLSDVYENQAGLYQDLFCINTKGVIVSASSPGRAGINVSEEPWFQHVMEKGVSYVGPIQSLGGESRTLIGIVQPIRSYPDRQSVVGVLTSLLNWEGFTGTAEYFNNGNGNEWDKGLLRIVDETSNLLFQYSADQESAGKNNDNSESESAMMQSVQKAVQGESGHVMEVNDQDEMFLSGFAHSTGYRDFKGIGWSAIFSVPRTAAYEPVYRMSKLLGIVFLLCLILIPAIAVLFSRGITRPISKMIEIIKDLAEGKGDLTRRIEVQTNDELKELADWTNRFIQNIQDIVLQIKETMKTVYTSSKQISASTEKLAVGTEEQNNAIQEISSSIDSLEQMNRQIAKSSGNLALHTEEASSSIMEMTASSDEVAENARHSSGAVEETSSSITQMLNSINNISSNIEALSSNADQTSSSIEEINRSIREVEKNAKNSLQISEESVAKAEGGVVAVTQTQEGMDNIQKTFEESSQVIKRLGEKSVKIGKILRVIDDVADQTNLLALNAAIIAAQAGKHGKGFAVVADEIKALAERSSVSSGEITEVIRSVQKEAGEAVQSMEVSSSSILQGIELSSQAKNALQQIMQSVDRSRSMIEEITQATVEQSKGSQMVKKAAEKTTESLRQIAEGTLEQQKGSKQIIENTERLRELITYVSRAMQEQAKGSGQITSAIEEINDKAQDISRSIGGQAQKNEEVLSSSKKIEQVANKNTQQVQEMTGAISEMAEKVERLQSEIDKFKA